MRRLLKFISVTFMLLMFLLAVAALFTGYFQLAVVFGVVFVVWWVIHEVRESRSRGRNQRAYERWLNDSNVPVKKKQHEMNRRRRLAEEEYFDHP